MITLGVLAPKSSVKDPNFGQVSLLLHGNGTNGSTTFVDSSLHNRTVTVAGNAKLSTAQAKFGSASMLFDGSGDYAFQDSGGAPNGFTIECWIYPTAYQGNVFGIGNGTPNCTVYIGTGGSSSQKLVCNIAGTIFGTSSVIPLNSWTHVALTRNVSTGSHNAFYFFVNGVLIAANSLTTNPSTEFGIASSGVGDRNTSSGKYAGYIDDMRYTIGVNRYTATFTPPAAQYPDS